MKYLFDFGFIDARGGEEWEIANMTREIIGTECRECAEKRDSMEHE